MRRRRSSLASKRTPKVLSGLRQLTCALTQMRGRVSKANETSSSMPIETSSGLLTDMPPVLISLLVAVKRRLLVYDYGSSGIDGIFIYARNFCCELHSVARN